MKGKRGGRRSGRKAGGRRRGARGGYRTARKMIKTTDFASCVDTVAQFDASANTTYTLYNLALTNSIRARTIAEGYQLFRIAKVEVLWKPVVDTFVGTSSVPTLYYMIDKVNVLTNADINTLKQAGARPHTLNERLLRTSFAPAIRLLSNDTTAGVVTDFAGNMKVSPWLPTNANAGNVLPGPGYSPNTVDHGGLVFGIQQTIAGAPAVANVEVRIHYEFKRAAWYKATSGPGPIPIDLDPKSEPVVEMLEA